MPLTIHRDLRTPGRVSAAASGIPDGAGFSRENAIPVALAEVGPTGQPWLRSTLVDGQTGAGSAIPNERADAQFGGFPLNTRRILRWYERFVEMPTTSLDRWQVVGPEIHGPNISAFPQALLMLEVGPDKRRRLNANAGRSATRYDYIGPIELGRVYAMLMDVYLTSGNEGYIRVWRDGVLVAQFTGPTIHQASAGSYWKEANYRNAQINGRMVYDVSDMVLYSADLGDQLPDWPGPIVAPPPGLPDTTGPRLELTVGNDLTWRLDFPDDDATYVLLGVAGDPVEPLEILNIQGPTIIGRFDPAAFVAGRTYWAWAIAQDAAGNETVLPGGRPFTPVAVEPPPPPPTPPDPCAAIAAERDQAILERDQARAGRDDALVAAAQAGHALAAIRTGVAASVQRHVDDVASVLDA